MSNILRSTKDDRVQLAQRPDGTYQVKVARRVIFTSRVLTAAEIYFDEEVEKLRAPTRVLLTRERAHNDALAMSAEASARKSAHAHRRGGKGGRGGVGG